MTRQKRVWRPLTLLYVIIVAGHGRHVRPGSIIAKGVVVMAMRHQHVCAIPKLSGSQGIHVTMSFSVWNAVDVRLRAR